MKELERTSRISISAVLFLLVILIGFLTFKKPLYIFQKNAANTLEELNKKEYELNYNQLADLDDTSYTLIDIRNPYEYAKGHLNQAVNIPLHDILTAKKMQYLNELKDLNKTIVLYGENPGSANNTWMLLYQLGFNNIKVLCIETYFVDNKFQTKSVAIEKANINFAEVMQNSTGGKSIVQKSKTTKKVMTILKKKKRVAEGGC